METGLVAPGCGVCLGAQHSGAGEFAEVKVIAFYTGRDDKAHISFVKEANRWFPRMAADHGFAYEATTNLGQPEPGLPFSYQGLVFLDTRPELPLSARRSKRICDGPAGGWGFILPSSP